MSIIFLLIGVIYFIASNDAVNLSKGEQKLTLRGRIVFPNGPRIPIESDGKLTVELQDTSLADAPAKVIAQGVGKAIRFPMAFAIKYTSQQVIDGMSYSLRANIRNKNGELLYTNDVHIGVKPIGADRTKLIDVPVILVKKATEESKPISVFKPVGEFGNRQWPDLVGANGDDAVNIIKKETGFRSVMTIKEGSMLTMDYRTDRVRVFVNNKGIVSRVPTVA